MRMSDLGSMKESDSVLQRPHRGYLFESVISWEHGGSKILASDRAR